MAYQDNILGVMQFFADCIHDFLAVLVSIQLFGNVNLFTLLTAIAVFKGFLIFLKTVILNGTYSATPFTVTGIMREKRNEYRANEKHAQRQAESEGKYKDRRDENRKYQAERDAKIASDIAARSKKNDQRHDSDKREVKKYIDKKIKK